VSDDSDEHVLYIKAQCSLCLGGIRKGIFMNCPYCDADRKTFIEAPFTSVKEVLSKTLTTSQKKELTQYLKSDGK
jgi:hypothetical protein